MSKLIEALNRLQSVRTEEGLPSSLSLLTDSRPDKSESVQQHQPDIETIVQEPYSLRGESTI